MSATQAPRMSLAVADRQLPARDVLLDCHAMRDLFASRLGTNGPLDVASVVRLRTKYRPGESLRVLYRLSIDGGSHLVSSRMRSRDAAALYQEAQPAAVPCPPLQGVLYEPALQSVFWSFPNDRRLGGDPEAAARRALALAVSERSVDLTVVSYAPERAVIYRAADAATSRTIAFAKVYGDGSGVEARALLDGLQAAIRDSGLELRVPRALGSAASHEALLVEALPGVHLNRVEDGRLETAFRQLGVALGALHALPVPLGLARVDPYSLEAITDGTRLLSSARPDLRARVHRVATELEARRPDVRDVVWTHGDLNSRNWLLHDGRVGLFDFDQVAAAPAHVDLGGVLAWMRTKTLTGQWPAGREAALVAALLEGYQQHRPLPTPAARCWACAAALLLERAVRAVTRVREDQLAILPDLLAAAAADVEACRHA